MPKTYNPKTGAYVVHSLNKGSKESLYVLVQMKIMDGAVHIQGRSPMYPKKNRAFGMVWDFHPSKEEMAQIQTWLNYCTTGGLVEPVSDEQEAQAVFDETAVKCEKCNSIMCSCGKCPKCDPMHGKLVKPMTKPGTKIPKAVFDDLAAKVAKLVESPTCPDCSQPLCSNCEQCHQCEGIISCYDESDAGDYEEDKAPEEVTLNTPGLCEKCGEMKCETCNECHICENASAAGLSDKEDSNV